MRKIIIPLLLLASTASGQFSLGGGAGTSTHGRLVMDMQLSGEMGRFQVGTGFSAHLSNRVKDPAVLYARAMVNTVHSQQNWLYVGGGYAFGLYSFDNPELNHGGWLAAVQYEHEIIEFGRMYVNAMYFNKLAVFTIGLKAIFR